MKKKNAVKSGFHGYYPYCESCDAFREVRSAVEERRMNFCPDCGRKLIKAFRCPVCKVQTSGSWKYCVNCGVRFEGLLNLKDGI